MTPKIIPFLPFLKGAFNKIIIADIINSLIGNPVGKLIDRFTGKEVVQNNDNLGLNKRLMNLRRGGMGGGVPTRGGALRFLGDGSGRLDDAPDIVPTNQSVLDDIASLIVESVIAASPISSAGKLTTTAAETKAS